MVSARLSRCSLMAQIWPFCGRSAIDALLPICYTGHCGVAVGLRRGDVRTLSGICWEAIGGANRFGEGFQK